jgi:hypothetical protein
MLAWGTCCRFPLSPFYEVNFTNSRLCCATTALGSGILFSYPQISTIAGVQGLVVYTLSSSLPLLIFGLLGPVIRRKCPEGFVLTEWTRQRYGIVTALYLSVLTYALRQPSTRSVLIAEKLGHTLPLYGRRIICPAANHHRFDGS